MQRSLCGTCSSDQTRTVDCTRFSAGDAGSMPVRLRLARFGRKAAPFYRIFVADARAPRDGKHVDVVGHFDPIPGKDGNKHITLNIERIKYWMSVGAQPSEPVARLLGQAGVMPVPPPPQSRQTGPKKPDKGKK